MRTLFDLYEMWGCRFLGIDRIMNEIIWIFCPYWLWKPLEIKLSINLDLHDMSIEQRVEV